MVWVQLEHCECIFKDSDKWAVYRVKFQIQKEDWRSENEIKVNVGGRFKE